MTWWWESDAVARRAVVAAWAGWMLDSFDVMLFALVLPSLMRALHFDTATAGWMQSLSLIAGAAGGLVMGVVADRVGRTRALMASVLVYSVGTAACGFAGSALQLAVFRIFLGFGMGGEWASGVALVSETCQDRHRDKALAFIQSGWPVGYALASVVSWFVQHALGLDWRAVFFVGIVPALLTLWIRGYVPEPERWLRAREAARHTASTGAIGGRMLGITVALAAVNACMLFAYWGFNTFVPSYLVAPAASGGAGMSQAVMSGLVMTNQFGTCLGFMTFGHVSASVGRKRAGIGYLLLAGALVVAYTLARQPLPLLVLGLVASFFSTGYFSSVGGVTAELYPTAVRATAQGVIYNTGRIVSAAAPWLVGGVARSHGFPAALSIAGGAFVLAALMWTAVPDTSGRSIQ